MSKTSRDIELFVVDIFVAIEKIKDYIKLFDSPDGLWMDSLRWDATLRELEIVGESLNALLKSKTFSKKSPKYFRKVVNFRNSIIHEYFGIDSEEVWDIVTNKLDVLKLDLIYTVKELRIDLKEAIESAKFELKKRGDDTILRNLEI